MKKLIQTAVASLILGFLPACAVHADVAGSPKVLINLDARFLQPGSVHAWTNGGSMGGIFSAKDSAPTVRTYKGRNVVMFGGNGLLRSSLPAPAAITGSNDWSLEIWAFQHDMGGRGSTMVSWAPRNNGVGRTAQFTWSTDGLAAIHWGMDVPWKNKPMVGKWQHIVFTRADGIEKIYVNGLEDRREARNIDIAPGHNVVIGAVEEGDSYRSFFKGAIALIRVYDGALPPAHIARNYRRDKDALPSLPPLPPGIENNMAAGIRSDSVYVNGRLTATGGAQTKSFLCWGTTDGGSDTGAWQQCVALGTTPVGDITRKLTSLRPGTRYYYRLYAVNSAGSTWAAATSQVTTRTPRTADASSFRIIIIPDTQNGIEKWPKVITAMSEWIARNKHVMNIKYVMHVGDIVQTGNNEDEWKQASRCFKPLDGTVPYIMAPGNHDYDRVEKRKSLVYFNRYFPVSRFNKQTNFGGSFPTNTNNNSFHMFEAGGVQWLVIALQYNPSDTELEWANRVVAAHPMHSVLVVTHSYLTHQGKDTTGEHIWEQFVRRHPNITAVFCGHLSTVHYEDTGDSGNKVCEMLFDWQNSTGPDMNSYCAMIEIDPDTHTLAVECYSPWLDRFLPGVRANFEYSGITVFSKKKALVK